MEMLNCSAERIGIYKANSAPYSEQQMEKLFECSEIVKGHRCEYVCDENGVGFECLSGVLPDGTAKFYNVEKIKYMYNHPSLIFDLREQRKNIPKALAELEELCRDVKEKYK